MAKGKGIKKSKNMIMIWYLKISAMGYQKNRKINMIMVYDNLGNRASKKIEKYDIKVFKIDIDKSTYI